MKYFLNHDGLSSINMSTNELYIHLSQVPVYQKPNPLFQINYEPLVVNLMDYRRLESALEHENILFKHSNTPLWHLNKYAIDELMEYTYSIEEFKEILDGVKKARLTVVITSIRFISNQFMINLCIICREHLRGLERRLMIDEILVDL